MTCCLIVSPYILTAEGGAGDVERRLERSRWLLSCQIEGKVVSCYRVTVCVELRLAAAEQRERSVASPQA